MSHPVDRLLKVLDQGWRFYFGNVDPAIYKELGCPNSKRARWFERRGVYLCLGCSRGCCKNESAGFAPMLPVDFYPISTPQQKITDDELLRMKRLLNRNEAMSILRIGRNKFYELVEEGLLETGGGPGVTRVTSESVLSLLRQPSMD